MAHKDRDKRLAYWKEYYRKNRAHLHPHRSKNIERNEEYLRACSRRSLFKKYGLTSEKFAALLEYQGCCCAICTKPFPTINGRTGPNIDHDHTSGNVRGLLCARCNVLVGFLETNPLHALLAMQYIDTWRIREPNGQKRLPDGVSLPSTEGREQCVMEPLF